MKRANGVKLGRPREMSEDTVERIRGLWEVGPSASAVARRLNEEGVPTPRNGHWHAPGVTRALRWVRA